MVLSDVAVRRPVTATVLSLLLIAFGLISYERLALREFPDIDPPIVSIDTRYPGASAAIVETRITELLEERIAGIEGIRFIESSSRDGSSQINIEFSTERNVDNAANDVRDRVSGVLDRLPEQADPPEIEKVDSNADVIMWLNLTSTDMGVLELTDYASRYLQDRFSTVPGVARVRISGGLEYAMRIWLDRDALAARGLTANDVEDALRSENVELPAGQVESEDRLFTARVERTYRTPEDFRRLVVGRGSNGHLVRLAEVAEVEKGAIETRTFFRGNTQPMVGLGIIKQSTANTVAVARGSRELAQRINPTLPPGMTIAQSYDTSVFIDAAIAEVWKTLAIAIGLVVLVIWIFLGSARAMIIPAVTVPVSLVSTFIAILALGFSVNLLTLLAMVLAVGLVVDDSIVVLENVHRRIELGESPLVASYLGARQVGFAVVATTAVLVSVFVPIGFVTGDIGRLFSEFALTLAAAVAFSSLVALTLTPVLTSKLLRHHNDEGRNGVAAGLDKAFDWLSGWYRRALEGALRHPWLFGVIFIIGAASAYGLVRTIPTEYAPAEDRGAFFMLVNGPEGATFDYMNEYMDEIEQRMMPLVESGEVIRLLVRAPRSFGGVQTFNTGFVIVVLADWSQRRSAWEIMNGVRTDLADLAGVRAFPIMPQGFGGSTSKPVQYVIGGGTYEELAQWRDTLVDAINANNPGLRGVDWDYKETQPQLRIVIDQNRAADLGVPVSAIGRTLQTMLGSRRVTTYIDGGEEYDVILEGIRDMQRTKDDVTNLYVRSDSSGALIPLSNLVTIRETSGADTLNRYNRVRAVTLEANLDASLSLGEALDWLDAQVRERLPSEAVIDYKGQSKDLRDGAASLVFVFLLGLAVVFLVLAAQFESFVHPFIIMFSVPLAMAGALLGLWLTGNTLNIYSQIGLVMLVGLAAKNGILIVEFANQLRDEGRSFEDALLESAATRLRPILMTGFTTAAGAVPLILSFGAGAETRETLGVVILFGASFAMLFTLFVVPMAYRLLARGTGSPRQVSHRLDQEITEQGVASATKG